MITGTTWIMMSAKGVLSAQGRCVSTELDGHVLRYWEQRIEVPS